MSLEFCISTSFQKCWLKEIGNMYKDTLLIHMKKFLDRTKDKTDEIRI